MSSNYPKIGYVLKKYPRLSETFILNEILGLEKMGVETSVFSIHLPDEGRFHADVAQVRGRVRYLPPLKSDVTYEAFRTLVEPWCLGLGKLNQALRFIDALPAHKRGALLVQTLHLARQVSESGVDHLHAHFMTVASWAAYLTSVFTGIPFSVTAHAKDIYRQTVDRRIFSEVARNASRIITVSDFNRQFILEHLVDDQAENVTRIYNGIELTRGSEVPEVRDPRLILAVGRLVEKKGFCVLIDACRILADRDVSFRCVLVGEGDEKDNLVARTRRLGLEGKVEFLGALPREEVSVWMQQARVLAAPCVMGSDGNRDALPTVLIEALAHGLPCISTPVTGIPEIIEDGKEGLLVPEGNATELALAIEQLLESKPLWDRFSQAGPLKACERFDRSETLPELVDVFVQSTRTCCSAGVSSS